MKLKCLGCEALARPLYLCATQSPHVVEVELFRIGLHGDPAELRGRLQKRIDAANAGGEYDAVVLAYGLCGKATEGLAARDVPVVIPRAHDCITLFLGSRGRYDEAFARCPGTYWYTLDYVERRDGAGTTLALGAADVELAAVYDAYVEKYGRDNADYLMEVMGAWQQHYRRAVFIDMGIGDGSAVEALARQEAAQRGWTFERVAGDMGLVRRLLMGDWGEDFLVLQPGQRSEMAYDDDVVVGCWEHGESVNR